MQQRVSALRDSLGRIIMTVRRPKFEVFGTSSRAFLASHARLARPAFLARRAVIRKGQRKAETLRAGFGFSRRGNVLVATHLLNTASVRPQ